MKRSPRTEPYGSEVLERLKPYSETPKYRRLIRFLWWYFVNNSQKESCQGVKAVTISVTKIIGDQYLSMVLDILKAEGAAEGESRGTALTALRVRFKRVPKAVEHTIRTMTDLTALASLAVLAKTCESLDEFEQAID